MTDSYGQDCPSGNCDSAFERVRVSHLVSGGSRITWELEPSFRETGTYSYTLQVGRSGNPNADDWTDVGLPVNDAAYLVDDQQRLYGINNWTHYRIKLVTGEGTHYSKPQPALGDLSRKDWLLAREIIRSHRLDLRAGAGTPGYLLKRRTSGDPCSCLDYQLGIPRNAQCPDCYGTGFIGGYQPVIGCSWAELSNDYVQTEAKNDIGTIGIGSTVIRAKRMLYEPQMFEYDVWVNKTSDERYVILRISSIADVRGVTVLASVDMELIEYTHPIYSLEIADQEN